MPADVSPTPLSSGTYTPAERRSRIRIYVWQAGLVSFLGGIIHLSALSDDQLAHTSAMRWVLTLLVLFLSPIIEGINALRAAIDRSTSAPVALSAPDAPAHDAVVGPVHSSDTNPTQQ